MAAKYLILVLLTVALASSRAELPPQAYKTYQAQSPEALTIKVTSVTIVKTDLPGGVRSDVTATAQVETVARSASGLHPGDSICIRYSTVKRNQPMPGPSEPDILTEGLTYPAFVEKVGQKDAYGPAAGGHSFRE